MCSVRLTRYLIVVTAMLWSLSLLANLSGTVAKVLFKPNVYYQSHLYSSMFVTTSPSSSINYTVTEAYLGQSIPPNAIAINAWQKKFSVKVSQRDDGGYDIYRLTTPSGERDGETLLEGSFVRDDDNQTAVLEYKDIDDGTWVRMEVSNTRTAPPETDKEKEEWRLIVVTTITDGPPDRGRKILKIEDELKWFDIVAL